MTMTSWTPHPLCTRSGSGTTSAQELRLLAVARQESRTANHRDGHGIGRNDLQGRAAPAMPVWAMLRDDFPVATRPNLGARFHHAGRGRQFLPGGRGCWLAAGHIATARVPTAALPKRYQTESDPDADFNGAVADPAVVDEAWAAWREEVAFAEQVTRDHHLGFAGHAACSHEPRPGAHRRRSAWL